ncbi:MAG: hypothetical protein JXB25_11100 [Deltaproteobacteria bacterium]|nr:hypothetical protein [Deltaproteobacteria bacterium]
MTKVEILTLGIAFWGAVTGSIALLIQFLQHRGDKSDLKLIPKMSIGSSVLGGMIEARELIDFELEVVNVGRRVARIDEVGISVKGKNPSKNSHVLKIIIYDSQQNDVASLNEGEKKIFKLHRWNRTMQDIAEYFSENETAYVRLTSGKQIKERFDTVSMSKLAELRAKAQQSGR